MHIEPGGFCQWDDYDVNSFKSQSLNTSISHSSNEEIIRIWYQFTKRLGLDFGFVPLDFPSTSTTDHVQITDEKLCCSWISELSNHFAANNLTVTDSFRLPISDALRTPFSINELLCMDELALVDSKRTATDNSGRIQISPFGTAEEFKNLKDAAERELSDGVTWGMDLVLCVGKKAQDDKN